MNSDAVSTPFFSVLAYSPVQDQASGPAARVPGQAGPAPAAGDGAAVVGDGSALPAGANGQQPARGPDMMLFLIMAVFAFMIISMMMSGRKQRKQTQEMLAGLSRGDTVQTTAGIIAVVGEVRDDLVVLKIDESNHTKMKVAKASISRVIKQAHDRSSTEPNSDSEAA